MAKFDICFLVKDFVTLEVDAEDMTAATYLAADCCDEFSEQLSQIANMRFIVDGESVTVLPYAEVYEVNKV